MFKKLVAIEPVSLIPTAEEALHQYAEQVELYRDIPADDEEIVRRIGDADAALLSYTSRMGKNVIERCPNLRYIGMCCSLYSEESANVDIAFAREKGIKVLGIRDYGDRRRGGVRPPRADRPAPRLRVCRCSTTSRWRFTASRWVSWVWASRAG